MYEFFVDIFYYRNKFVSKKKPRESIAVVGLRVWNELFLTNELQACNSN